MTSERLRCTAFGRELANPLGLAAGLDKNGVAADRWQELGFGFAEIGTVTPEPQAGNPKPRMFRYASEKALVNRLGFNNLGSRAVARNLEGADMRSPIGVNIGKGRATPLDAAAEDYRKAFEVLADFGDYVAINVSSPNTPGLRSLQKLDPLKKIVDALRKKSASKRIFVKLSPDQSDEEIGEAARWAASESVDGIIATNTTLSRPIEAKEEGGLSGAPLRRRAEEVCGIIAAVAGKLEIIGVGGIFTGEDLYRRLRAGATVCQIYTSFVYRGPTAAPDILGELLAVMDREGVGSVSDLRDRR
jgi:dihydroorotate dehydrogenase